MKLYYSKGACSLVARIIINELGLVAEYESVDLATHQTQSGKNFYEINPKGSVPTLLTNDNQILTENAVILQYLADTAHASTLLAPVGDFKRYRILEWLNYCATELHKGFGPLFNKKVPQEVKDTIFIPILKSKFAFLDKHLAQSKYLSGDEFTLPDAYLFVMLRWAGLFAMDVKDLPNLTKYFAEMLERKSVKDSLNQEGIK